jgi:hypothetical protein
MTAELKGKLRYRGREELAKDEVHMASSTIPPKYKFDPNRDIWDSLKQAIAASSGFKRWQDEKTITTQMERTSLDYQVRRYLREALETLAY